MVPPGVRTCSPLEEGILHAQRRGLAVMRIAGEGGSGLEPPPLVEKNEHKIVTKKVSINRLFRAA